MPSASSSPARRRTSRPRSRTATSSAKVLPEPVGPIMVENRIEVHEMVSSTESLESLFFELTGGEGMHPGHAAGSDGRLPATWSTAHHPAPLLPVGPIGEP